MARSECKETFGYQTKKILEVRRLYHNHLIEMQRLLLSTIKDNAFFRGLTMERKCQYSFIPGRNKPYYWLEIKADCAWSGGCSGRECRCCDQPLRVYSTGSGIPWKVECIDIVLLNVGVVSDNTVVIRHILCLQSRERRQKLLVMPIKQ